MANLPDALIDQLSKLFEAGHDQGYDFGDSQVSALEDNAKKAEELKKKNKRKASKKKSDVKKPNKKLKKDTKKDHLKKAATKNNQEKKKTGKQTI